jgi:2-amino-4-deoxychorismate synthase
MTSSPGQQNISAATGLETIRGYQAWAAIRFREDRTVTLIGGDPHQVASVLDIPVETGQPEAGRRFDRLVAIPFRQVAERGFAAHDDDTPLVDIAIADEFEVELDELLGELPDEEIIFTDRGGFDIADDDYSKVVETIVADEIGQGEGANLVIGRNYHAAAGDWGPAKALTVFRRLLERERGAYWTFCFFTGDRYLIGASPERHVSVHAGEVRMNPISGTFRLGERADLKPRLLDFLRDEKEIYELFMVVDEELKMMCEVCQEGGQILGPFLKPMSHLVHTEYLLAGRTGRDVREVLRDTMYAATVTGSPVENACRLIREYEPTGRGYYGAALALIGRDAAGRQTADSPILIRTADVTPEGEVRVTAGATLVRDSDPVSEVAETHAKAAGILSAFGLTPVAPPADGMAELMRDEDVLLALHARNRRLSPFWLTDQSDTAPDPQLRGASAVILDNEDDFVNMLRHVLASLGMTSTVLRHDDYHPDAFGEADLVIVGPGPGDPRDGTDPKVSRVRAVVDDLIAVKRPFLAVCLGLQTLCERLGIPLVYKDIVFQGTQSDVVIGENIERVGFYNTFVGRLDPEVRLPTGVTATADQAGDIHLLAGPNFRGIQFHAESILTEHGPALLGQLIRELIRPQ